MAQKYTELCKRMHDRGLEIDVQLRNLTKINSEMVLKCEKCLTCIKEFSGNSGLQISCSICLENDRTHVFLPCRRKPLLFSPLHM